MWGSITKLPHDYGRIMFVFCLSLLVLSLSLLLSSSLLFSLTNLAHPWDVSNIAAPQAAPKADFADFDERPAKLSWKSPRFFWLEWLAIGTHVPFCQMRLRSLIAFWSQKTMYKNSIPPVSSPELPRDLHPGLAGSQVWQAASCGTMAVHGRPMDCLELPGTSGQTHATSCEHRIGATTRQTNPA